MLACNRQHNPRSLIIRALLLDGAGQLLILGFILCAALDWLVDHWEQFDGQQLAVLVASLPLLGVAVRQLYGVALAASRSRCCCSGL